MPEWISVKDRLPDKEGYHLVYIPGYWSRHKEHHDGIMFASWHNGRWPIELSKGNMITHWMPLPEPPKEDEEID